MHEQRETLAAQFAAQFTNAHDGVIAFVEACPAEQRHTVTVAKGWTVAAVCRHIARGFAVHPQLIRSAATGGETPTG